VYHVLVPLSAIDRLTLAAAMLAAPAWLRSRRNMYRPSGHLLRDHELAAFEDFFEPRTLREVRVSRVEEFRPWPLEKTLRRVGFGGIMWSRAVAGIALVDTVVIVTPTAHERNLSSLSLLFHELVHIEQYRVLGVRGFLREYIGGWLAAGRSYEEIPLEVQAFELTERYDQFPSDAFDVGQIVRREFPRGGS
jgi:hypothetical protein